MGSIRATILILAAAILVPVALLGAAAYWSFARQVEAARSLRATLDGIVRAGELGERLVEIQERLDASALLADVGLVREADRVHGAFRTTLEQLQRDAGGDPAQVRRLAALGAAVETWRRTTLAAMAGAIEAGGSARPRALVEESRATLTALERDLEEFVRAEGRRLEDHTHARETAQRQTRLGLLAAGVVVLISGAGAGLVLGRRVVRPLVSLTAAVERVAAGDLSRPVTIRTGDELERLSAAVDRMVTEVAQREDFLERARREAETFVEVQQDLAETLDLIPVLQKIARHARLLCRSDLAYIAPFDPRAGVARVVALLGERTAALRNVRIEPGRGLAGRALESRRPFRTASYLDDARLTDVHLDPVTAEGVVAALAVPMILEQELIGLIYVANRTPQLFTDHDEATLLRLAVPAALAIRGARLVTELAQERDLLAVRSRELDRSGAQLRGIVQAASDGILTVDPHGRITSANRAAEDMFGYPRQELLEQDLHRLVSGPGGAADPWGLGAPASAWGGELEGRRREGSRFPLELSVSVVRTEQDHFFAVVVRDITERKRAYETRFQLAALVESSDDAIIGWTPDLTIASWNPGAVRIYGYSADEARARSLTLLVPPDRIPEVEKLVERIRRGEHLQNYETVWLTKDGRLIDVSLTISATRDEAGRLTGFSTIARDITERKAIERLKNEFIATVSHELRTPLTSIRGHLELVLDGDAGAITDLQRQFLTIATQNTDRLGSLINDLLDVEKLEAGKMQMRRDPVDLAGALREVVSTFRLEAEKKALAFRDEIAERLVVLGDRDRLIQVFANLISNAIKYTPAGEVRVVAARVKGQPEVVVHDTGIGMSGDEQKKLFTKFFRSQESVVRDAGGTGLGLVIAKAIVEGHGGRITVESCKGSGTRFRVVFPGSEADPAPERRGSTGSIGVATPRGPAGGATP